MLGKLIAYEFRGLWRPVLIVLLIMAVAGVAGTLSCNAIEVVSDYYGGLKVGASDVAGDVAIALVLFTLFSGFVVWAGVIALFIVVGSRYDRTMFTDQGYLTLTLPVSTAALVLAKYLAAFILMLAGVVLAIAVYSAMLTTIMGEYGPSATTVILAMLGGSFGFFNDAEPVAAVAGTVNTVISIGYQLGLAWLALALGAWWAKRHKMAAAVGIFLGVGWLVSLAFSIADVIALTTGGYSYGWGMANLATGAVSVVRMVSFILAAVGCVALSVFVVRRKVDLS